MQGKQLKKIVSLRTTSFNQQIKDYIEQQLKKNKDATVTGLIIDLMEQGLKNLSEQTGEGIPSPSTPKQEKPFDYDEWYCDCEFGTYFKEKPFWKWIDEDIAPVFERRYNELVHPQVEKPQKLEQIIVT